MISLKATHWTDGEGHAVRVRLKGIHRVKMRLATGESRVYFYAWRGGPPIKAVPGTPEFISLYHAAHASLLKPKPGTLMTLIAEFKASAEFRRLSPSSVKSYTRPTSN